jgi:hypothetical protein
MAHTYSTDSDERRYIPFFLALAAIGATFVVFRVTEGYQIKVPWWASPPVDSMAFYGLFYLAFDRYIWKWRLLHWLRIAKIPDVSGEWDGQAVPTPTSGVSAGLGTPTEIRLSIRQTWTSLLVTARTSRSGSHSVSGAITVADDVRVTYQYVNEPSASAPDTMHTHRGTALLTLDHRGNSMNGEYYSGRDRQNFGTIQVSRNA